MTPPPEPRDPPGREPLFPGRWVLAGLAGACLAALAVRSLGFPRVFPGAGLVLLDLSDSSYHARRALYSFVNFPSVLWFDAYIAYPDGAPVPMPPLYDWLLGGVARLFGRSGEVFERVAAWASVVPSAATLLPLYAAGRRVAGAGVGLGAAWLFALWPASSLLASVGNLDHHATVTLLVACWLASSLAELRAGGGLRAALHGALVAVMVLTWSGSLLYVLVGEGARFLVGGVLWSHRRRLWAQAGGALLAAALVAPWVAAAPEPIGGVWSSTTLSWLHVAVLLALAALAAALAALEGWRPQPRVAWRALRAGALAGAIAVALFTLPGLGGAVQSGAGFVSKQDEWAKTNPEQKPLFEPPWSAAQPRALGRFGLYAYLVPLAPLLAGLGLRRRAGREAAALLVLWTAPLSVLALQQVRFAHDFAAPGSLVFAATLGALHGPLGRWLRLGPRAAGAALAALGLALLGPALAAIQIPKTRAMLEQLANRGSAGLDGPSSGWESAVRFAETIRRTTPETSGFLDARERPEYGLLVPATLGHTFVYVARRPVPANNFGPYLDEEKFNEVRRFYRAVDEDEAVAIAERLEIRFVVTADSSWMHPQLLIYQLHHGDGSGGPGWGHVTRFRLVSEGPARGVPLPIMFPDGVPQRSIPYKLFERVEGALLEIASVPGGPVQVEAGLETPLGRRFAWRASADADAGGVARLRVPYATDGAYPVRMLGPYQVTTQRGTWLVEVPDAAVRAGARVPVAEQDGRQGP